MDVGDVAAASGAGLATSESGESGRARSAVSALNGAEAAVKSSKGVVVLRGVVHTLVTLRFNDREIGASVWAAATGRSEK